MNSGQTLKPTSHPGFSSLKIGISSKRLRSEVRKEALLEIKKTKYEVIKSERVMGSWSEVNKRELFHRYPTFKASLSWNCVLKKCFEFPGNLPPLNRLTLCTCAAFDRCGGGRGESRCNTMLYRKGCPYYCNLIHHGDKQLLKQSKNCTKLTCTF